MKFSVVICISTRLPLHRHSTKKQYVNFQSCTCTIASAANKSLSAWGVEGRVPFLDKEFLDVAMNLNPKAKMCPGKEIEKRIVREAFAEMLPESVAWRQKEQFSDGVGYSWIDTLREITAAAVSDQQMEHAARTLPYQHATK